MTTLLKYGANPNLKNCYGQTPLYILTNLIESKELVTCFIENSLVQIEDEMFEQSKKFISDQFSR